MILSKIITLKYYLKRTSIFHNEIFIFGMSSKLNLHHFFCTDKKEGLKQDIQKILLMKPEQKEVRIDGQTVIQVSKEEYLQMLRVLQTLNEQINEIQSNEKTAHNQSQNQQQQQTGKNEQYFFSNQEQIVSLKMMQVTQKQQLFSWISKYSNLDLDNQSKQLQTKVKCQYVILCRFYMLEGDIFSNSILNILKSVSKHVNLLSQNEVVQFLSIIIQRLKTQQNRQIIQNFQKQIIQTNEFQNAIYQLKNRTNESSQLVSLLLHLFRNKKIKIWNSFKLKLESYDGVVICYNSLNLSHIICSLTSCNIDVLQKQYLQTLYLQTLKVKIEYNLQESLKDKASSLGNLRFESIVYLVMNYPQSNLKHNSSFVISIFHKFIQNQIQFSILFSVEQQLRIILSVYQTQNFNTLFQVLPIKIFVLQQTNKLVQQIMVNQMDFLTEFSLLQSSNQKFTHIKQFVMIFYQIWTQMYRNHKQQFELCLLPQNPQLSIKKLMNQICKAITRLFGLIQTKDLVKYIQKQGFQLQGKLAVNLSLFQLIVKTKIMIQVLQKNNKLELNEGQIISELKYRIIVFITEYLKQGNQTYQIFNVNDNRIHQFLIITMVCQQLNIYNELKDLIYNQKYKNILNKLLAQPRFKSYQTHIKKLLSERLFMN